MKRKLYELILLMAIVSSFLYLKAQPIEASSINCDDKATITAGSMDLLDYWFLYDLFHHDSPCEERTNHIVHQIINDKNKSRVRQKAKRQADQVKNDPSLMKQQSPIEFTLSKYNQKYVPFWYQWYVLYDNQGNMPTNHLQNVVVSRDDVHQYKKYIKNKLLNKLRIRGIFKIIACFMGLLIIAFLFAVLVD